MIKLGISACFFYPDLKRSTFGPKTLNYLENDMACYVTRDGIIPVLIPMLDSEIARVRLCQSLDALVLQGGSDLSPCSYGADYLDQSRWPGDKVRDQYELSLVDHFFQAGKPILGICRGAQLLNVYFGGTLWQDISMQCATSVVHRDPAAYDHNCHPIVFEKGGFLERVYQECKQPYVNSVHHQSINALGADLRVEARSLEDDIIEAFRHANFENQFVLGIQWHPEFSPTLENKVIDADLLMNQFIARI